MRINFRWGRLLLAGATLGVPGSAQNAPAQRVPKHTVRNAKNPFARVIVVPFEYDEAGPIGSYGRFQAAFTMQPLIPLPLGQKWDLITQTSIAFLAQPDVDNPGGRKWGTSDITTDLHFTLDDQENVQWGLGPAFLFPAASDEATGTGKWGAGATGAIYAEPGKWTLGVAAKNVRAFAGDARRADLHYLTLTYQVTHNFWREWYLTSSPTVLADWTARKGDRWLMPVGLGIGKVWGIGSRQLSAELGAYYSLIHPETEPYPKWVLSLQFAWAHTKSVGSRRP